MSGSVRAVEELHAPGTPSPLVRPGTVGRVVKVDMTGLFADVQFEGVVGLWNVHLGREVEAL